MRPLSPGDPTAVGGYRLVGRLGVGGMGTVYGALTRTGERLAIKVIHPGLDNDPGLRARFRREVELLRRVSGPCLVPLVDANPDAAQPWLATPYIPGPTLQQFITGQGPLSGTMLTSLAAGTAAALASMHALGVTHRDLKPGNVILAPDSPRVLDFGIAHSEDGTAVTRTGILSGTPGWISPEQYTTGASGPAADIFAWGALIAYAATARLPFGTGAPDVIAHRVLSSDVPTEPLPEGLRALVDSALAKDPTDRPEAAAISAAARELLAAASTHVLADQVPTPPSLTELIERDWHIPTVDDPTWTAYLPQQRRSAARLLIGVGLATFAVTTAATLALNALPSRDTPPKGATTGSHQPSTAAATPSDQARQAPTSPSASSAPASTPAPATTPPPRPAYTRADNAQPHPSEFLSSRPARQSEVLFADKVTSKVMRATERLPDSDLAIRFNDRAQTVYLVWDQPAGGAMQELVDEYSSYAPAILCQAVKQNLRVIPETWAFGRWVVIWAPSNGTDPGGTTIMYGDGNCDEASY